MRSARAWASAAPSSTAPEHRPAWARSARKPVAIASAGPHPRPSPASGRGETTHSVINSLKLSNPRLCTPSPARGRGLG
ncbi:protein of unknown function (plasmid) [Cupriavidus neocaledonicus]|uniref:Uncharacterized protein n=1 Tax=Cupriavidus neocaledonicus TaxID=1040979 RepID=A0A375HUK1_9BURK|nr:hypothetical protein CBM2605_B90005 [Cupriavidus neocaledonicus]SPD60400.1 protein of unknown function [Cupriavidus neocaledonicus]